LITFQFIAIDFSRIAVLFGFLSAGNGVGRQNLTSNFIAGLILLLERPIIVGDRGTVSGIEDDVLGIHLRATTIRPLNNRSILVPDAEFISDTITNWSHK